MKVRNAYIALGVAALLTVSAACSSNTEEPAETTAPMETTTDAPAEAPAGSIAEIASANEDFSTLVAAVDAAGLTETLAGDGEYTVFAPTNDAFAALPEGTVEALLKPKNQEQLAAILTYHVVPATVMAADVAPGEVTTVNGATFEVSVGDDGSVTLTDGQGNTANVVTTDIVASNGVIHVIDAVMLPPEE